jgi:hypothetical protein
MPLTDIQVTALRAELLADPRTYGYAAHINVGGVTGNDNDQALANLINLVRTGTNGGPAIPIKRDDVASREIMEAIRITDFTALPVSPNATQLSTERRALAWMEALVNADRVRLVNEDGSDTPVMANFGDMFAVGTSTRTRLTALSTRNGSRAEELFGRAVSVSVSEVGRALRNPPA